MIVHLVIYQKLFHKLINIQRNGKTSKLSQLTVDGKILVKPGDIAEGWATYFERLNDRCTVKSRRFDK
jgi:hypothetical protein